jgi:hypothetical protein
MHADHVQSGVVGAAKFVVGVDFAVGCVFAYATSFKLVAVDAFDAGILCRRCFAPSLDSKKCKGSLSFYRYGIQTESRVCFDLNLVKIEEVRGRHARSRAHVLQRMGHLDGIHHAQDEYDSHMF